MVSLGDGDDSAVRKARLGGRCWARLGCYVPDGNDVTIGEGKV
jgi:hypothetical protein